MPRTNKLVDINRKLSDAQRSIIMKTPFRYLVEMKTSIVIYDKNGKTDDVGTIS